MVKVRRIAPISNASGVHIMETTLDTQIDRSIETALDQYYQGLAAGMTPRDARVTAGANLSVEDYRLFRKMTN